MFSANREGTWPRFAAPTLLLITFLAHSWFGPDVFYHLAWGREIVTAGHIIPRHLPLLKQPITANGYWLFQSALYLLYSTVGIYVTSAAFALVWLTTFRAWSHQVRLGRRPTSGPWLMLLAVVAIQSRFEQRPEVISYCLLIVMIGHLRSVDLAQPVRRRSLLILVGLEALWCNVHGYFALGPLLVGAKVVGDLWAASPTARRHIIWRGVALLGSILLASLISPFGTQTWSTVFAYAGLGARVNDLIQELAPPGLSTTSAPLAAFWIGAAWTVIRIVGAARRRDGFAVISGVAGVALALQATRNVPLLFLMGAPLWNVPDEKRMPRKFAAASNAVSMFLAILIVLKFFAGAYGNAIGYLGRFGVRLEPASYPIAAAEFLKGYGFTGRIFNDSYDGGYLEFTLPGVTVAGDSYFSAVDVTRTYLAAIRDPEALRRLESQHHFDAFLINLENAAVYDWLVGRPDLRLAHVSPHRALFLRDGRANPARGLYYEGDDLHHWANAFGPAAWVGVARRHREGERLLQIAADLARAPALPTSLLALILTASVDRPRCAARARALALKARAFPDAALDLARWNALLERLGPCAE